MGGLIEDLFILEKKIQSIEQNKSSSLETKCKMARIEVDYSSSNLIL